MKNKEYIMVGAPIITREIFRKVLIPLNNYSFKPSGGYWASEHISNLGNISDWFTYLQDAHSIARYKNLNQSTIFNLKDNAKILTINSLKQILELAEQYPSYHHILGYCEEITKKNTIFDFKKLSKDYDGVYIDFNAFWYPRETIVFDKLSVNSLLLFNLDCIKEYQTTPIVFDIDNPYSFPFIKKDTIETPQKIEEESYEHKMLTEITKEFYLDTMNKYYHYSFEDYDEYLSILTQNVSTVMKLLEKEEDKKITEISKLLQNQGMYTRKEQIIQNLVLNYLSEYLTENEEIIKTLPKSKIRKTKSYSIY